jgi:hypothetical protein
MPVSLPLSRHDRLHVTVYCSLLTAHHTQYTIHILVASLTCRITFGTTCEPNMVPTCVLNLKIFLKVKL